MRKEKKIRSHKKVDNLNDQHSTNLVTREKIIAMIRALRKLSRVE